MKAKARLPERVLSNEGLGGGGSEGSTAVMMPPSSLPLVETLTMMALGGGAVTLTNIFSLSRPGASAGIVIEAMRTICWYCAVRCRDSKPPLSIEKRLGIFERVLPASTRSAQERDDLNL